VRFAYNDGLRAYEVKKPFEGVITNMERRWKETESDWAREEIGRFMSETPCKACDGFRLKPEALAVKIDMRHIGEISRLSVKDALEWVSALPSRLSKKQNEIAPRILKEIRDRLTFLLDVGLEYLTLARGSGTLPARG
jgi:excinuclease ABC subunit A